MDENTKDIGILIKQIRESMGITMSELADRVNISKNYLNRIERGLNENISLEIASNLAKQLSRADSIRSGDIDLTGYDSPLVKLIFSELDKAERIRHNSNSSIINEIMDNFSYISEELRFLVEHAHIKKQIDKISKGIETYNFFQEAYKQKNKKTVDDYSEILTWILSSQDIKNKFNKDIKEALESGDGMSALNIIESIFDSLTSYLIYINASNSYEEFLIKNK